MRPRDWSPRTRLRKPFSAQLLVTLPLLLLLPSLPLPAAEPASRIAASGGDTAPASARSVVVVGRLLDVHSGKLSGRTVIEVANGRIVKVGGVLPPDAAVVDLSDRDLTVLPGLIDCHAHLLTNWQNLSPATRLRTSSAEATLWGVTNGVVYLNHGFTTVREAGESDEGYGQFALRDAIAAGRITGPRILSAGNLISLTGGHGDADVLAPDQSLPRRSNIADTLDELNAAVRRDLKYGADWIKLMATGGIADPFSDFTVQELSEEQMRRAVELAHRAHRRVMAHAEGTEGIKAAARAGVDSIEHGTMLDEEGAALMAQRGIWLVPTLYVFQRSVELGLASGQESARLEKGKALLKFQQPAFDRALRHHLKIAFGLDHDPVEVAGEFRALVRGGLSPLAAIQAATVNAAELLGLGDQLGAIEPGKAADLIAVEGNPLADIGALERVMFVMKGGKVVKSALTPAASPRTASSP